MLRNDREKIKIYVKRAAFVLPLIFILWQVSAVTMPFESATVSISGVFSRAGAYVEEKSSAIKLFFQNKQALVDENKQLQQALRIAKVETLLYEEVRKENEELKKILGRDESIEGVLGRVLLHPNRSPYDTFLIDVGKGHEISVGSLVVSEKVLLGVIDTVYERNAKVQLFSSPGTETSVIVGSTRIPAVARGLGGGMFEIKIPRDIEITEGDRITYPSMQNYLIGLVSRVDSKPSSSFQTILFRAPLNIFTTQFVIVTSDLIVLIEEQ